MKRNKSLLIGLICGLCCMACVGLYVMQVDSRAAAEHADALARYGGEQLEVCVARRDIASGETIEDSDLETKMWVAALLPEGAVTVRADAVGKQVASSILEGEVVSERRFGSPTYTLDIPEGLTAVSVPARDVQAVGGALTVGMRADVYAIGASSTTRLASGALVLATSAGTTGGSSTLSSGSVSWVTLAVAPEIVQELVTAAQNLELYFVLPTAAVEATSGAEVASGAEAVPGAEAASASELTSEPVPAPEAGLPEASSATFASGAPSSTEQAVGEGVEG